MARVVEFLTANLAVNQHKGVLEKYRAMGLETLPPSHMPEPPAEITDVTIPIGDSGAVSVIAPTADSSPLKPFLEKRGEGVFSIAVRVDDLEEAMREWSAVGLEWVLEQPYEFAPGTPAARRVPERLRVNWIKPKTLNGVMLECFEFIGDVHEHEKE